MDTTRSAGGNPKVLSSSDIPFVGWSRAAHEFRQQAALFAPPGSVRPLIIGEPGVGKRTMARAWQVAGGRADGSRIEVLEWASIGIPSCSIGVTTSLPPRGRYCVLLGRGARGPAPDPGSQGDALEAEILDRFEILLYMPPIGGGREIDVLAFLDYWNRARSPFVGIRYKSVAHSFLRRTLFGEPRPGNLEGVYRRLRMLNHLNRPTPSDAASLPTMLEVETLRERPAGSHPGADGRDETGATDPDGDEDEIPFEAIRDLAVRIYLWCCQHEPAEDGGGEERAGTGVLDLGLPGSLGRFAVGLTAADFLRLTDEQFVRDHVLPGLPEGLATRPDRFALLMDRVCNGSAFGTTFRALQEGLGIDPARVEMRLGRPADASRTKWTAGDGGRSRPGGEPGEVASNAATPGWTGNRFCIEENTYYLAFGQPGGRVEQGRFPLKGVLGLAYYHHLIGLPECPHAAPMLERAAGRQEGPADGHDEWEARDAGLGAGRSFDPVLDEEGKRRFAERLKENERELAKARRGGDTLLIRELEEEARSILAQFKEAVHDRRDRNLDRGAKQAQDRVRKALEDARTKLNFAGLPRLADYLKDAVRFKDGKWTFRPPRSSPDWQT